MVVPVSTENKLHVYDTTTFEEVTTIKVGAHPWDMMVSADGKYCCEPDMDSDTLTIIDPNTWKVTGTVPTGEGTGPFMVTIWPDNKTASVECSGHHGAGYNHLAPPAVPTGKGFSVSLVDLAKLNGYITPDPSGKYLYASVETGLQVIDTSSLQVVETIRIGGVVGTPFLLK